MPRVETIADLFVEEPMQWGVRGDPHLWRAMRNYFTAVPLPTHLAELEEKIAQAFLVLSGQPLSTPEMFYVARFAHGGMSSGYISPSFWRERALPLLRDRYSAQDLTDF
ncbi:MAG: hypothetical protein HS099_23810 [Ardenticatenaceae bacterium]|nr:hypothetical protein [Ardenticatenaceae bacterium]